MGHREEGGANGRVGGGEGGSEAGFGLGPTLGSGYSCLVCLSLQINRVLQDSVLSPSKTGAEGRATLSMQCE